MPAITKFCPRPDRTFLRPSKFGKESRRRFRIHLACLAVLSTTVEMAYVARAHHLAKISRRQCHQKDRPPEIGPKILRGNFCGLVSSLPEVKLPACRMPILSTCTCTPSIPCSM